MADPTRWKLNKISARLIQLLNAEKPKDRQRLMEALARRLREDDLTEHFPSPKESPALFAQTVIDDNPAMYEHLAAIPLPSLSAETAEELINALTLNQYDHG